MKKIFIAIALLSLVGCGGINYRETNINIYSGKDTTIDAAGATNTTGVDQKAAVDLQQALEAAKSWIESNAGKVLDSIKSGQNIIIPVEEKLVPNIEEVE